MANEPTRRKRKTLTLGEKVEVIRKYEEGGIGARGLAQHFDVGKTQIQNVIKGRTECLDEYKKTATNSKKRTTEVAGNEGRFSCDRTSRHVSKVSVGVESSDGSSSGDSSNTDEPGLVSSETSSEEDEQSSASDHPSTCKSEGRDCGQNAPPLLDEQHEEEEEESDDQGDHGNKKFVIKDLNALLGLVKDAKLFCASEGLIDALLIFNSAEDYLSSAWRQRQTDAKQ